LLGKVLFFLGIQPKNDLDILFPHRSGTFR
jgi:hypothetical protein